MAPIQNIDAPTLAELLKDGKVCLVDVRSAAEVAQGRIAGAAHIPLNLVPLRHPELPRDLPLVLYCAMGGRSAQACQYLAAQGYSGLHNLAGGVNAWLRAGQALERG